MKSTKFLLPMVGISLLGLLGLFIFGHVAGNAQSWYEIGQFSIQPAEFVKIICYYLFVSSLCKKTGIY